MPTKLTSGQEASSKLFRLLFRTASIASLLILVIAGYAVSHLYNQHLIEDSAHDAVSVGQAIVALEKHQLLSLDEQKNEHLHISREGFPELDRTMQAALVPFDIIKIKIFSLDGTVVYSTDHSIIGRNDQFNPQLQKALGGGISSTHKTKDQVTDLLGEKKFDVDVVATYIPIFSQKGTIVGSFEVYQDVSKSNQDSIDGILHSLVSLTAVLATAFALSFFVIRVAGRELNEVHNKLVELATIDSLTGIKNRETITAALKDEFYRCSRLAIKEQIQPISVIMIDVDHFKSINDKYGHYTGDKALKRIVRQVSEEIRKQDSFGRYGGEEFILLLPDTTEDIALVLADRIRRSVEGIELTIGDEKVDLTISLGLVTVTQFKNSYEDALKLADSALYQAKNQGRNRVVISTSLVGSGC